jgi:probable HAF family extracellular repeat protein
MFIWRAYITGPDGVGMRLLGTPGESDSFAASVNDSGQVVGGYTVDGTPHPFITGPNGVGITDLNSLVDLPDGVMLTQAVDINNNGQVIATGIPEPETYALMLAGLALIGFVARQKRGRCRRL